MENMITVEGLSKRFGDLQAVDGVSFSVKAGTLFAFLGPNGAGKSTTIDILCTLLKPDGGKVTVDGCLLGRQDDAIRKAIGVVFQDSMLDPLLSVRENLVCRARFYGLKGSEATAAVDRAAQIADTGEFMNRRYGKLSGGQRRRADIARALVHTPKVLFLDEPTTGLDPKTKEGVWQMVSELQKKTGMTVFLTTHYMEEAATADYIVIMNHGRICAEGTPYALKERYSSDQLRFTADAPERALTLLRGKGLGYTEKNGIYSVNLKSTLDAVPLLSDLKGHIASFEVLHGSMNDVFLNLTEEGEARV